MYKPVEEWVSAVDKTILEFPAGGDQKSNAAFRATLKGAVNDQYLK